MYILKENNNHIILALFSNDLHRKCKTSSRYDHMPGPNYNVRSPFVIGLLFRVGVLLCDISCFRTPSCPPASACYVLRTASMTHTWVRGQRLMAQLFVIENAKSSLIAIINLKA